MNTVVRLSCSALLLTWIAVVANAQRTSAVADAHVAKAKVAAFRPDHDISDTFDEMCTPLVPGSGTTSGPQSSIPRPPRSKEPWGWAAPTVKVFDNLYYVGTNNINNQAAWAVTTSAGIIIIDTTFEYTVKEQIENGLKRVGLNPADIKYVIVHHAHGDRYLGAKYLQDTFKARIVMSEADWEVIGKDNIAAALKPKKDMVATDGMKLTLGDTTISIYVTPGHTPGTLSTLVPLKDGTQRHLGYIVGGRGAEWEANGVKYFPDGATSLRVWLASIQRFHDIAMKAGADTYLTIHPLHDNLFSKFAALRFRRPGAPHPFVNKQFIENYATVMTECLQAQLEWLKGGSN